MTVPAAFIECHFVYLWAFKNHLKIIGMNSRGERLPYVSPMNQFQFVGMFNSRAWLYFEHCWVKSDLPPHIWPPLLKRWDGKMLQVGSGQWSEHLFTQHPAKSDQITAGAASHRLATTKSTGEQTEFIKRSWEWDSPHEWHHLLHDVFAKGDDNKEFLWEEKAALVLENQQTTGKRKVRTKYSRRPADIRSNTNSCSRLKLLYNQL